MAEYRDYELEYIAENQAKFYQILREHGASEENIEKIKAKNFYFTQDFAHYEIEEKLKLLSIVGFPIEKLCDDPYFMKRKLKQLLIKCEMAIVEGVPVDSKLLNSLDYVDGLAIFGARERGFLPEDWNIFGSARKTAAKLGISKRKFIEKFYSVKSFKKLHDKFREISPVIYQEFCSIKEFRSICMHGGDRMGKRESLGDLGFAKKENRSL